MAETDTQTAQFYGSSDDLIEVDGVKGGDEFCNDGNHDGILAASFNLGGKMRVYAVYDGCWMFAVGQVDEGIPLPDWPIRLSQHKNGYSTLLEVDVPNDVKLFRETNRESR